MDDSATPNPEKLTPEPTDTDSHPVDAQPLKKGELSDNEKLDIALQGSMLTSEPPQISEPRSANDDPDAV